MDISELEARTKTFDFISMVRMLEAASADKPRVGMSARVSEDVVRLSQHVSLGFSGTSLESLEKGTGGHEHRLYCNFLGLLGSNGPMPLHYTEHAIQRAKHHNDPTFGEFVDLFNQRMLSLFYRASVQFDPMVNLDRPGNNNFHDFAGALGGFVPRASSNRDAMPDSAKYFYAGWLANKAKSPDGLIAMVQDYFDVSVSVKEFTGGWLKLPQAAKTVLGDPDKPAVLGGSTYIGSRVWSIGHRFVLSIGPISWEQFNTFKPGSHKLTELNDLVRNYLGDEWAWELELKLGAGEVKSTVLDKRRMLGFSSYLGTAKGARSNKQHVSIGRSALVRKSNKTDRETNNFGVAS